VQKKTLTTATVGIFKQEHQNHQVDEGQSKRPEIVETLPEVRGGVKGDELLGDQRFLRGAGHIKLYVCVKMAPLLHVKCTKMLLISNFSHPLCANEEGTWWKIQKKKPWYLLNVAICKYPALCGKRVLSTYLILIGTLFL